MRNTDPPRNASSSERDGHCWWNGCNILLRPKKIWKIFLFSILKSTCTCISHVASLLPLISIGVFSWYFPFSDFFNYLEDHPIFLSHRGPTTYTEKPMKINCWNLKVKVDASDDFSLSIEWFLASTWKIFKGGDFIMATYEIIPT